MEIRHYQTTAPRFAPILYRIALITLVLLVLSLCVNVVQVFTPKVIAQDCNSFGSYADAVDSYKNGNRGLDGDGDGIPCESRK